LFLDSSHHIITIVPIMVCLFGREQSNEHTQLLVGTSPL